MITFKTKEGISISYVKGPLNEIVADCTCMIIQSFKIVRSLDADRYNFLKAKIIELFVTDKLDKYTEMNENEKMYGMSFNPEDLKEGE